jgi:hypothetical protein
MGLLFDDFGDELWTRSSDNSEFPITEAWRDFIEVLMWAEKHATA